MFTRRSEELTFSSSSEPVRRSEPPDRESPHVPYTGRLVGRSSASHHSSLGPLACDASAVLDKLLNIVGVESQWASAGAHLYGRQIRLTLTGGVLNHP